MPDPPPSSATSSDQLNAAFWDKLYKCNKDKWTSEETDQALLKHIDALTDGKGNQDILVPMCGKSQVLHSLAERGHRIVGIEWSKTAVEQFFDESHLSYSREMLKVGEVDVPVFTAKEANITMYCGDFFLFEQENLGGFDCVFDHGAIGSFECSEEKRILYAKIISLFVRPGGRVLFSFFDYIHSEHPSVPYAVTEGEVTALYQDSFNPVKMLQKIDCKTAMKYFGIQEGVPSIFDIWKLSHFSWKIVLLVKP